jgi:hypothetical protein
VTTTFDTDVDASRSPDVGQLFVIYGAVDQSLEDRVQSDVEPVARLLPVYREPDTPWFNTFARSTELTGLESFGDPAARAQGAMENLAYIAPRCRNRARRLFGVSVAAHAFPQMSDETLAAAAVGRRRLEEGGDVDSRVKQLAEALRSDPETDTSAGRDAWWDRLRTASGSPDEIGPRPCSGQLSRVPVDGVPELVPTIRTEYDARIPFDKARRFCDDPVSWKCFPCWCDMVSLGSRNGVREYQEIVSFHCHDDRYPKFRVNLNFATESDDHPPRAVTTEYWLADTSEPRVLVNQGYIQIRELEGPDPRVRIVTTKSIKFGGQLGGSGLSIVACHLGYLDMLEDVICCASRAEGEEGYPDLPFEGLQPSRRTTAGRSGPGSSYGSVIKTMVDEAGAAVEEFIDEWAQAAESSAAKLEAGYKADDLAQDMADCWMRMLRQGTRFADAGVRAAQATSTAGEPQAAQDATPTQTRREVTEL